MRFLLLLLLPALLLVAACGGDDDDSSSSTPTEAESRSATASRSPTPTAETTDAAGATTEAATPTPTPTPFATEAPTRRAGITADHYAENTSDYFGLTGGLAVENVPCPYDAAEVVIDCSGEGYGRIAIDLEPRGEITQCQAITHPDNGAILGVGCNTAEPALWLYKIVE